MNPSAPPTDTELYERLRLLLDPEIGLNIVDLGMVQRLNCDTKGNVALEIVPTTPNCPLHEQITDGARVLLESLPGVKTVDVSLVFDPPWTPERLTPAGREFLEARG